MKCLLCGYDFEEDEALSKCIGCPISKGCNLICCPNCGYEMSKRSKLIEFLKKRRLIKNESK